jgi:sensor histidine kinase YesM
MHAALTSPALRSDTAPIATASRINLAYWALQFTGWGFHFYAQASGEAIFASVAWSKAATLWGGYCLAGLTFTHLLRWFAKRNRWVDLPSRALLLRIIASLFILASAGYAVCIALSLAVYGQPVAPIMATFYAKLSVGQQLFNEYIGDLIVFVSWLSIYFGVVLQRQRRDVELRQAKLSEALQAAELRLLKSQLNPHFLFNALNSVRALIADQPAGAQDAVTQLARTLRYTLASSEADVVTLARELEMVDDYLALESLRLAERLNVVRDIEPAAMTARIPVMLLQTLVENAIKHGIAQLRQGGTLRISARLALGRLIIEVDNPRPVSAGVAVSGVGLKNSSERLRLLFGSAANLHLDLSNAQHATATVMLPA